VAHLVEREMRDDGLDNAVRRALKYLRGMFAIVLVSVEDPEKIVAVRNGPPIVVGLGDDEFFVASDIPAILAHTRDVVFLGDEEMAVITRSGVQFTDYAGKAVSKTTQRVLWDPIAAEKGGHKHFMLKEILEQPTAARDTILARVSLDRGRIFLEDLNIPESVFQALQKVTIVACGTSWHAALVGKYLIESLAQIPVEVDYGSEYRYRNPIVSSNELAIVITQSGETADTLAALREAKRKGARSIAICNVVGSMATREAEGTVYTHAGPEIGVASTKAFTSQLVALQLLALYIAQARASLTVQQIRTHIAALLQLPQTLELALKASSRLDKITDRFYNAPTSCFLDGASTIQSRSRARSN
jgi:glucosamine--fructose-6-phosphate aminotransferase (isomerizing)